MRDLPWRRLRDPWAVLVVEVMAQQTQLERVIPRWTALIANPMFADISVAGPGFMNFKLENVYVGAIPLLFAVLGLATAFGRVATSLPSRAAPPTCWPMSSGPASSRPHRCLPCHLLWKDGTAYRQAFAVQTC